jgi:4-carboxymuconolactone decarboxylase
MPQVLEQTRLERGRATLAAVDGHAGEAVVAPLGDLGRYVVEFAYGDIYSREGLSLRDRELATVAVLTALGGREPQLRFHLGAALNVGLSRQEVEEVIVQTVPYAGFPTAINALNLLGEVAATDAASTLGATAPDHSGEGVDADAKTSSTQDAGRTP